MNQKQIEDLSVEVDALWRQEESYWQQQARVKWLQEGDANTKVFHQSTLQRRRRNKVIKIKDEQGQWLESPQRVAKAIDTLCQTFYIRGST